MKKTETTTKKFKDSGERRKFATGAQRDCAGGKGRMDLLPPRALIELAKIYETGALKYDERNWEKGINISAYIDSALRHMMKFMMGMVDEPHLKMALWNIVCATETIERMKEGSLPEDLFDLPMDFPESDIY